MPSPPTVHRSRDSARSSPYRRRDSRSASPHNRTLEYRERDYRSASARTVTPQPADEFEPSDNLFVDEVESTPLAGQHQLNAQMDSRDNADEAKQQDVYAGQEQDLELDDGFPAQMMTPASTNTTTTTRRGRPRTRARLPRPMHLGKKTTYRRAEDDPINVMIKDLRCRAKLPWDKISQKLDEYLIENGDEPQELSVASVYSRFKRNAGRVAKAQNELDFDHKDWIHLRHPHHYPNTDEYVTVGREPELRNGGVPALLRRNIRMTSRTQQDIDELKSAELSAALVQAVDRINDNFYKFVADDMERTTGKLYTLHALEQRHKEIKGKMMTVTIAIC